MKISFYCDCGAAFVGKGRGPIAAQEITAIVERARTKHLAEGHTETDAAGAAAARRKAESAP